MSKIFLCLLPVLVVTILISISDNSEAQIRGAVYIPADTYNTYQSWYHFSECEAIRDLKYAKQLNLNSLRVFVSYNYWVEYPIEFEQKFESFLSIADQNNLKLMPVLFEAVGRPMTNDLLDIDFESSTEIKDPFKPILINESQWDKPEAFVHFFINKYGRDERLFAIEVINEPRELFKPFAINMMRITNSYNVTVPITVGTIEIADAVSYIPYGNKVLQFHNNLPINTRVFEKEIVEAIELGKEHDLEVVLGEWQRLRGGNLQDKYKPDYASLTPIVNKYKLNNFFWSLMVKPAYLTKQRKLGRFNGVFFEDGSVYNIGDAKALSHNKFSGLLLQRSVKDSLEVSEFDFDCRMTND